MNGKYFICNENAFPNSAPHELFCQSPDYLSLDQRHGIIRHPAAPTDDDGTQTDPVRYEVEPDDVLLWFGPVAALPAFSSVGINYKRHLSPCCLPRLL